MTPDSQSPPNWQPSQPLPQPPPGGYPPPQQGGYPPPQQPPGGYPAPQPNWTPAPQSPGGYPPPQPPNWTPPPGGYPPSQQPAGYPGQPLPGGFMPPQQVPYGGFPPPPLPPSAPPPNATRTILIVVVVVALVAAGIGAIFAFSPHPGATAPTASSTATSGLGSGSGFGQSIPSSQHHHVGEQVKLGSVWQMTVNSVTTTQGGDFEQPKAGDQYIVVDVSAKNISASIQNISEFDFQIKDATGQVYSGRFLTTVNNPPDGAVQGGDTLRGQIPFEVPTSQHSLQFIYTYNYDAGQAAWDLSV